MAVHHSQYTRVINKAAGFSVCLQWRTVTCKTLGEQGSSARENEPPSESIKHAKPSGQDKSHSQGWIICVIWVLKAQRAYMEIPEVEQVGRKLIVRFCVYVAEIKDQMKFCLNRKFFTIQMSCLAFSHLCLQWMTRLRLNLTALMEVSVKLLWSDASLKSHR